MAKLLLLDGGTGHLLKERGVEAHCPDLKYEQLFLVRAGRAAGWQQRGPCRKRARARPSASSSPRRHLARRRSTAASRSLLLSLLPRRARWPTSWRRMS